MIEVEISGVKTYRFTSLVLDLNGTITLDGQVSEGVPERLEHLDSLIQIYILTADTLGKARELPLPGNTRLQIISPGNENAQKCEFVRQLGSDETVAVGAGANDSLMLKEAALGICVMGPEGTAVTTMQNADVLVPDINDALDLLLKKERLVATLRR